MKQRIFSGWTLTRALYVAAGIFVIIQSLPKNEWLGVLFGGYFASMGIFAFGCAAGTCAINRNMKTQEESKIHAEVSAKTQENVH